MKLTVTIVAVGAMAGRAGAQPLVLPAAYATQAGQVSPSDTLLREFARTHQQVIAGSQLASVPVGSRITQLTLRPSNHPLANALGPWPPVQLTFADYEVYLGQGTAAPGLMSPVFADNVAAGSELRVRDGALVVPAGSFNNFVSPPAANPWGLDIQLAPFTYQGGDLVITIRHSGHQAPQVPRLFLDSVANPVPGLTQCMAATGMSATSGTVEMSLPAIVRIRYVPPASCYANCDGTTMSPRLTPNDYQCFLTRFMVDMYGSQAQQMTSYANCDGSMSFPVLNIGDFICFNSRYAAGCT